MNHFLTRTVQSVSPVLPAPKKPKDSCKVVRLTKSYNGGGGGGGGGQRPVLSHSKNVPFKKMAEHGTNVGQNGTFFLDILNRGNSKPDEGLKQPSFSLIGFIDEF